MSDTTANSNIDNTKQKLAWVTMAVGFGDKIGQDYNGKPLVLNLELNGSWQREGCEYCLL